MKRISVFVLGALGICFQSVGQDSAQVKSALFDWNGYWDNQKGGVYTLNLGAKFNGKWSYFSLNNWESVSEENSGRDLKSFYGEHNIRYQSSIPWLQLAGQWVVKMPGVDGFRLAPRLAVHQLKWSSKWMKKRKLKVFVQPTCANFNVGRKPRVFDQLEYVYSWFINAHWYISGFADQNWQVEGGALTSIWVTEHQIGFCPFAKPHISPLFLVLEYRLNQFLVNPTSWAVGAQYKFKL